MRNEASRITQQADAVLYSHTLAFGKLPLVIRNKRKKVPPNTTETVTRVNFAHDLPTEKSGRAHELCVVVPTGSASHFACSTSNK